MTTIDDEAALRIWHERFEYSPRWLDELVRIYARRLLSRQRERAEPIGETRENGAVWFGQNPHAFPIGTLFYAAPPPAPDPDAQDERDATLFRWLGNHWYDREAFCTQQTWNAQTLDEFRSAIAADAALRGKGGA